MIKLFARVANFDYLIACSDNPAAKRGDRFWADSYSDEQGEVETVEILVPQNLVQALLAQGTDEQEYSDGYEAWQAVLKYGEIQEIQESFGKIIVVKKDIAVNDNHIIEKNDVIQINGTKMDASSFILNAPVVIDSYYIEKGDTITVLKSKRNDADDVDKEDDKECTCPGCSD